MKACLLLTLLSVVAFSYGAILPVPHVPESSSISKGETNPTLEKAGKAFQNLGKILQGETGSISSEELQRTVADLKDIGEEYFIGSLLKKIAEAVKTVGDAFDEAINLGR
ncbi:uncharacterized protein LOC144167564 [Haemaphysalis longicornis]